jgi:hypothetical protein
MNKLKIAVLEITYEEDNKMEERAREEVKKKEGKVKGLKIEQIEDEDLIKIVRNKIVKGGELTKEDMRDIFDENPEKIINGLRNAHKASEELRMAQLETIIKYGQTAGLTAFVTTMKYIMDTLSTDEDGESLKIFTITLNAMMEEYGYKIVETALEE